MSSLGNLSSGQKDELMDQVRQQIAVANAQELLTVRTAHPMSQHNLTFSIFHFNNQNFINIAEND